MNVSIKRSASYALWMAGIIGAAGAFLPACGVNCPAGTVQVGPVCKAQSGSDKADASVAPATAGISADPGAMSGGTRAQPAVAGMLGSAGTVGVGVVAAGASGGSGGPGAGAGGTAASMPTGPSNICAGHPSETICDGPVMHHCAASGESAAPETCTSPTLCQVGIASKSCAVCNPGTFHCNGAQPQTCSDAGQYVSMAPPCGSVALCNETTGTCTDMKCQPKAKSCAPDGTLKTCNDTGSDFDESMSVSCGMDMCDAKALVCYKCTPNAVTCSGQMAMKCSADGQTSTPQSCTSTNDCVMAACTAGVGCTTGANQPALTPCTSSGGHQCDGGGRCVGCVDASVCGGKKCGPRNTCVACTVPSDCASSDCTNPVCNPDGSCGTPQNKGTTETCGSSGGHCDGNGACTLCGNGTLDVPENCDKASPEWVSTGFCTSDCKFSSAVFRPCQADMQGRCNSTNPYIFCSAVQACSWVCNTDVDCTTSPLVGARCVSSNPSVCAIPCTPGGPCPNGLKCVTFQKSGQAAISICGENDLIQQ